MKKRLIENIENKVEDNQMGFRSNRSTIDKTRQDKADFLEKS